MPLSKVFFLYLHRFIPKWDIAYQVTIRMSGYTKHTNERPELKSRIVEVARKMFLEQGIKAITMDDVASQMGISKRTLYEVFPDKQELLKACILLGQKESEAYIRTVYSSAGNVLEVILGIFLYSIRMVHTTNKKFFEEIKKYPEAEELIRRRRASESAEAIAFLQKGIEQGVFRSDVNFAIVNKLVKEQMNLLVSSNICEEFSFLEVYESIMFTYLRGIATEQGARELDKFIEEYRKR